jgi:Zn-dependent protease with chaperone function
MQNVPTTAQPLAQQPCPTCQASIPVYLEYVTWCDQCGWNLQPQKPSQSLSLFDRLYGAAGKHSSQTLLSAVLRAGSLKPGLTLSRVLAFGIALGVHLLTLGFALLGIRLLIGGWPNPFAILAGIVCLGCAWVVRPRFSRVDERVVLRKQLPALYQLADDIAGALGTQPVSGIVLTWEFNAAFTQVGWRQRSVVYLGLPLLSVLNSQEKVALLAHELAHGANGDVRRGLVVGTAVSSLVEWYLMIRPASLWSYEHGIENIVVVPANLLRLGLSEVVKLVLYVLVHLLWHDSQRAEYFADYLSAQVAGTDAAQTTLNKLHLRDALSLMLSRATWQSRNHSFLADFRRAVADLPERELERVRRIRQQEGARLNTTHPPTMHRIAFLQARPVMMPKVSLSPDESERLEQELMSAQSLVASPE